jgi:hypothetical protein
MKTVELNDEPPIVPAHEHIRKERPSQKVKKIPFHLEKIPKELRKKEAGKPLYLTRYE